MFHVLSLHDVKVVLKRGVHSSRSSPVFFANPYFSRVARQKSSLHRGIFEVRRQLQAETLEQDRLMIVGAGDAPPADLNTRSSG